MPGDTKTHETTKKKPETPVTTATVAGTVAGTTTDPVTTLVTSSNILSFDSRLVVQTPPVTTVAYSAERNLLTNPPNDKGSNDCQTDPDPRVSWVYLQTKAELQQILHKVGQSVEGRTDDLRKRLVKYVRDNRLLSLQQGLTSLNLDHGLSVPRQTLLQTETTDLRNLSQGATSVVYSTGVPMASAREDSRLDHEESSIRELLGLPPNAPFRTVQEKLVELTRGSIPRHVTFEPYMDAQQTREIHKPCIKSTPTTAESTPAPFTYANDRHAPTQIPSDTLFIRGHGGISERETYSQNTERTSMSNHELPIPRKPFVKDYRNDVAELCNQVRKWNLRFDGEHNPISFIERLNEMAESYEIRSELLLKALPELLKGDALLWFRNNKTLWYDYEDFLASFEEQYLPPDYRRNLEEEIFRRTQGENEPIRKFIVALTTLMRRRGGYSPNEILNKLYSNMRPEYKLTVSRDRFFTVSELIRLAEGYENYVREKKNYRPPPNPAQSLVPETAYDSRSRVFKSYKVDSVQNQDWNSNYPGHYQNKYQTITPETTYSPNVQKSRSNYAERSRVFTRDKSLSGQQYPKQNTPSGQSSFRRSPMGENREDMIGNSGLANRSYRTIVCWNCEKEGHRYSECSFPKKLKCFNCKKEGVYTTACDCSAGNLLRDRKIRGGPSLEAQKPPQPSGNNG